MSGQHAKVLQLNLDAGKNGEGTGRSIQFRWRLSETSGIPRQRWDSDKSPETD